ncbi:MAG: efflux RND transporter periplasmic adaptor subunit [Calothrix sp. C42_A2020_038]|nr:efflux RND transporter periplasmic adaptor subunit [Calothrix sp. C42_A2020_038]
MTPSEPQTDSNENSPQTVLQRPRYRRLWLLPLFLLLAVLGTSVAIWRFLIPTTRTPQTTTTTQAQVPATPVKLSNVISGTVQESSDFVASLQSRRSETLSSKIEGKITQIFIKPGQTVKEGAPILEIEPPQPVALPIPPVSAATLTAQSQLDVARSTLTSLEAERAGIQAEIKSDQEQFDRYNTLASQGAVSRQAKDVYANRLAAAKTNLKVIESKIQTQQAAIAQAQKAIQQVQTPTVQQSPQKSQTYRINAPFTGTVGEIPIKVGDLVNTSTQLLTITQNNPLEVHMIVPIERAAKVKNGMQVDILDIQGHTIGTSRVFSVTPNPSNKAQSGLVKALYNNSKNELQAEQFVRARVIWNQRQGALLPATAVSRVGGKTFVYVAEPLPDKSSIKSSMYIARQKQVKLGNTTGNNYQVLEGLQPNDQVVTSGLLNLRDGDTILPQS